MTATEKTLSMFRGDSFSVSFTFTQGEGVEEMPFDISGGKVGFTVKRNSSDTDENALLQQISDLIVDGRTGRFAIYFPRAETMNVPAGRFLYDIRWLNSNGDPKVLAYGDIFVKERITRGI